MQGSFLICEVNVGMELSVIHVDIAFLFTHHICVVEQILTLIRGIVLNEALIVFKKSLDWEISP